MRRRGGVLMAQGKRLAVPSSGVSPPGSIDPTGSTNVTASLQAWLNAQPNGSTLDFTGRTYRIDQQLNLTSRSNLTLVGGTFFTDDPTGDGTTAENPSIAARTRSQWNMTACTNIVVRNMTVRGAHPNGGVDGYVALLEAQMAFWLAGCIGVEIDTCTISDVYGDFVFMTLDSGTGVWSDGIHVHHGTMARNGRQAFAVVAARNVIIQYNTVSDMARAFCDMEPNGTFFGIDTVLIDSNTIGDHRLYFITSGGTGDCRNITVSNNLLTSVMSVYGGGIDGLRENWVINNNTSTFPAWNGTGYFMDMGDMVNVTVTNNTQPASAGGMALAVYYRCVGVTNSGNTVDGGSYTIGVASGGNRYVKNCGNRLTAGGAFNLPEVCVTDFGTPKQYSGLTGWYDAFQAANADLSAVDSMTDFSGAGRHLVASGTARPTFRHNIAGKGMRGYQFDGVDDFTGNTLPMSQFITASAYTVFVVFEATTVAAFADNDAVWSESAGVAGLYMHSPPDVYAYNADAGGGDVATKTLTLNERTLIMMRHAGGNLYISKNGDAETSVASGDTTTLAGLVRIGANYLGNQFSNFLLHEINFYNVALTTAQILDRTNRHILDWSVGYVYGAADTFTRADGALGVSELGAKTWAISRPNSYWGVVSGKAKLLSGDPQSTENNATIECSLSDCTITVVIDPALGGAITYRYSAPQNWNLFAFGGGTGFHYKIVGDSYIQIGSTVTGLPAGATTMKVVLLGSSVKCYVDSTLVFDHVNTSQQNATSHGLRANTGSTQTFDDFLVVQ